MAEKSGNTEEFKSVPADWKMIMDDSTMKRSLSRITYEILEKNRDLNRLAIVGIRTGGEYSAQRVHKRAEEIEGRKIDYGVIDITLYRDDLSSASSQPTLKGTDMPFSITGSRIVLVDDVFYTGRTIRAALDAIIDFGRPESVQLAVLVDRGHRELPIRPDFVGKNLPTSLEENVKVCLRERGYQDGVYIAMAAPQRKGK